MIVRQFNSRGKEAFRAFLAACRELPSTPVPVELLEDDALTVVVKPHLEVEQRHFETRRDAANYLRDLLSSHSQHDVATNDGLWTWLSLYMFDEVCPERAGKREVKNDYTYVFEHANSRHFYRHLLFISWQVLRVTPDNNRLLLNGRVSSLDQFTTEVMKRLFLTRIPCIFEVLDRLYWDERRGRARPGIVSPGTVKPGDLVHRLPIRIRQLEKTYDLLSLNADQLIELLGKEFRREQVAPVSD
jgi:hypothetical protein